MDCRPSPSAWDELRPNRLSGARGARSSSLAPATSGRRLRRALRPVAMACGVLAACGLAALHLAGTTGVVDANGSARTRSSSRSTNSDRTSNGVHSLVTFSGTLENIGEGAPLRLQRASQVDGRSYDMIQRNYFAHPILGCGQYVFSMMQAFGIHYQSAGENIGWVSGNLGTGPARATSTARSWTAPTTAPTSSTSATPRWASAPTRAPRALTWTGVSPGTAGRLDVQRGVRPGRSSSPPPPTEDAEARAARQRRTRPRPPPPARAPGDDRSRPVDTRPDANALRIPGRQPPPEPAGAAGRPSTRAFSPTASNPFSKHS